MDKYEIAVLSEDYAIKRQHWEALAVSNTPTDPEERIKTAIAYDIAAAEMAEAWTRLVLAKLPSIK